MYSKLNCVGILSNNIIPSSIQKKRFIADNHQYKDKNFELLKTSLLIYKIIE